MGLCKFQSQKTFTWKGVLENNINHILESHLKIWIFELNWFFDLKNMEEIDYNMQRNQKYVHH